MSLPNKATAPTSPHFNSSGGSRAFDAAKVVQDVSAAAGTIQLVLSSVAAAEHESARLRAECSRLHAECERLQQRLNRQRRYNGWGS